MDADPNGLKAPDIGPNGSNGPDAVPTNSEAVEANSASSMELETSPNGLKVPDADSKEQETDFTERNFIGNTRTTQMIHLFALTDHTLTQP